MHSIPHTGEGQILWQPSPQQVRASLLYDYQRWLSQTRHKDFEDYAQLWQWSIEETEQFWLSIWDYFHILSEGFLEPVLTTHKMPGAKWFPQTRLNYCEHVFRRATPERAALIEVDEAGGSQEYSWAQLQQDTAAMAATLRRLQVKAGDCVAGCLTNRAQAVIAFLACSSIGVIWSGCSPDMGSGLIVDRLSQIAPKVIFVTDSYRYNGQLFDCSQRMSSVIEQLPSVQAVIHVAGPDNSPISAHEVCVMPWHEAVHDRAPLVFDRLAFDHPLWVVYSSGTTGLPKAIVHSHGGMTLTHLKTMALQHDVRAGDRTLFLGSTAWIIWNQQIGGLLTGATITLYDGNPSWPDGKALWRFIDDARLTLFGCGAAYLVHCMKQQIKPREFAQFPALRAINAYGSPLPIDAYHWVYQNIKTDLWLASVSGGTDVASGLIACAPSLPVRCGQLQCRELGVAAFAFDTQGQALTDEVGELVVTQPMPSMPVYFWNDPQGQRYESSYFDIYPGVWRHGDWVRFTPQGFAVLYGRSDSTIKRRGIRIGTAEIYRVVEELPEVLDSLVIDLEYLNRPSSMLLFVVLRPGFTIDDGLRDKLREQIRNKASARHIPDDVYQIREVPRTLSGKKMEVPIRKLLLGSQIEKVANPEAMSNPQSLDYFVELSKHLQTQS